MQTTVVGTAVVAWLVASAVPGLAQTVPAKAPSKQGVASKSKAAGLTNADVLKMTKAGLSEALIIATVQQATAKAFDLTPDGLIELKAAGVSETVIGAMMGAPQSSPPAKTVTVPADFKMPPPAPASPKPASTPEIGVYFKKDGNWTSQLSEIVNWRNGGVLKHWATMGVVKGDLNGFVNGPTSRTVLRLPVEILVHAQEGVGPTEYQLLRLHSNSTSREFRTVTGGVMHVEAGTTRDLVPFEPKQVAPREYELLIPDNLPPGEYGILAPGATGSANAAAGLGKLYSFRLEAGK